MASEVVEISSGKRLVADRGFTNQRWVVGPLATVNRPIFHPDEKARLGRLHGTVAVDMETAAVAAAACQARVPWVALRAILDPMEVRLTVGSLSQGLRCLANPFRWGQLKQFMEAVRIARESLSDGLRENYPGGFKWI